MAVGLELPLDGEVVLDNAVVDDCNFFTAIPVRVCVDIIRLAVSCPARVADAEPGTKPVLPDMLDQIRHLAGFLNDGQPLLVDKRHAGRIITAIFQPPETLENYRKRVLLANIADYSAHGKTLAWWYQKM